MSFTDEDLKRLKERIASSNPKTARMIMNRKSLQGFIYRLEAAEKVCNHIKENGFPKSMRDKAYDYMNTWRKAKGEEG